jgi:hypothetical protein
VTRAPADPLDPCALLSTRAEAVLGSRLTDDAIWPTPSTPAKVRRAPSRSQTRHDVSFARAQKNNDARARQVCASREKWVKKPKIFHRAPALERNDTF